MLKHKIISFALIAVVLFLSKSLYLDDVLKLTLETQMPKNAVVRAEFKMVGKAQADSFRLTLKEGGKSRFRIYGGTPEYIKIDPADKIVSLCIVGRGKQCLALSEKGVFSNITVKSKSHFDFKFFVIWAFLIYGIVYTLVERKRLYDDAVPKIKNVEFLRLLFTIGVVVAHLAPNVTVYNMGGRGVDFFFLLSGFFLMITFRPERSVYSFVQSKVIHFIPLTVLCAVFNGKIALLPANMLFLQGTGLVTPVPPQGWYLGILFWVGLFYFYLLKIAKPKITKLIIAAMTFFSYCFIHNGGTPSIYALCIARGFAGIGAGCFLGYLYLQIKDKNVYTGIGYTVAEAIVLLFAVGVLYIKALRPANPMNIDLAFAGLIAFFVLKRGKVSQFFEKPFWAKISACSFAIYMTHEDVLCSFVFRILEKYPALVEYHTPLVSVASVAVCYLFGLMIWKYVELPATRWLKSKLQ